MFRIIRVPPSLAKFFQPLKGHFHGDHLAYLRLLVLTIACRWGRRHVATLYRYLDAEHHRTRFNNFFLVERWDPEAALRQQAQAMLRSLCPKKGAPLSLVLDDAKKANRGQPMDAVAKMKDSTTHASIRGHQYVCAILVCRHHVLPFGLRLYVKQAACPALGLPCRKTTELAAPLMRECKAPPGVNVVVLCDAYSLCTTVVKACREQHCHVASTLKSHRRLFKRGWKLTAGRYGRHRCRRRRTDTLALSTPDGQVHSRVVAAGWLPVSTLGPLHVVFSGKGPANTRLGLVTDAPPRSAPEIIRTDDKRGTIAHWIQDTQQLLGLGHDQHRSSWAAVTHRPLVGFASALLTHRRLERHDAQGRRRRATAADLSTAMAQDQLRGLLWGDLIIYLQEKPPRPSVIAALARLRVA